MDFKKIFKTGFDVALLKKPTMQMVGNDAKASESSVAIVVVVSLMAALGHLIFPSSVLGGAIYYRPDLMWILAYAIKMALLLLLSFHLVGYLASTFFNSKLSREAYARIMSYGSVVVLIAVVPDLAEFAGIWLLVLSFFTLRDFGKIQVGPIAFLLVLSVIIMSVLSYSPGLIL